MPFNSMGYTVLRKSPEEPAGYGVSTVFLQACPCACKTLKMRAEDSGTGGNNSRFHLMKNVMQPGLRMEFSFHMNRL